MILPLFLIPILTIIYISGLLFWGFSVVVKALPKEIRISFDSTIKTLSLASLGTSLAYAGYL